MTDKWSKLRLAALDSMAILKDLLARDAADDAPLISAYLETKHALAIAFEAFSNEKYADPSIISKAKQAVEGAMRTLFSHMPTKYLRVRGFGDSHALLLAYMTQHIGSEVSAATLRILTGDAIHTERRTRELRDLGFQLEARHTGGSDVYILCSTAPNTAIAARIQIAKNIKEDKTIGKQGMEQLLGQLDTISTHQKSENN